MKTTTFNGTEITVKELTVKQVRAVFSQIEKEDALFLDDILDQEVPALVIAEATGVSIKDMEGHKPSVLVALAQEVASVNPSVASLIKKRLAVYEKMQAITLNQSLTGQPAA